MKKTVLILVVFIFIQNAFCQFALNNLQFKLKNPPNNPYKITQTKGNELIRIEEVNQNGDEIFKYLQTEIPPFFSWREPHRFIYAFEYDYNGQLIKSYAFNSNAGHAIYEYVFDTTTNTKTTYQRYFKVPDSLSNTNAYSNISRINCYKDLLESSEVIILSESKKEFVKLEYLDEHGQVYRMRSIGSYKKDTIDTYIYFDSENREILKKVILSNGETEREIISKYPDDSTTISTILKYRDGKIISKYDFAEVTSDNGALITEYDQNEGTIDVRQYYYTNGYLVKIKVFETKYKKDLIVPVSNNLKLIAELDYKYNDDGLFENEILNNFQTGERESNNYKYKIDSIK
jgi:hypothetical protein